MYLLCIFYVSSVLLKSSLNLCFFLCFFFVPGLELGCSVKLKVTCVGRGCGEHQCFVNAGIEVAALLPDFLDASVANFS